MTGTPYLRGGRALGRFTKMRVQTLTVTLSRQRPTRMASVDLLAGATWRVKSTTPAASSATAAAVAHRERHMATAQHLRTRNAARWTKPRVVAQQKQDAEACARAENFLLSRQSLV